MKLVIVESPTKAKTIQKFLPAGFSVKSSFGHVRDLPKTTLGVDVDKNFQPKYVVPTKAKKTVAELKKAAAKKEVILATDEDREGEAIAWHLAEALKLEPKQTNRIVFHEITKNAILEALKNPRGIDFNLVDAQQARRVLDRLVGYKLSPLLWKKIRRGLSAGRVQSVALRLVVEREREIEKFKPQEYWQIEAQLSKQDAQEEFLAKLTKKDGKTLAKLAITNKQQATTIVEELRNKNFVVGAVETKKFLSQPPPPFTTSSLQQAAAGRLGYSAKQTMRLAQQLYEGVAVGGQPVGLITYMRTDSLNLAGQFLQAAQKYLTEKFGASYHSGQARIFRTKTKGAQEAHEAIRPTDVGLDPSSVERFLEPRQFKLYRLIWQRALASQMAPAQFDKQKITILADNYELTASGSRLIFDGFLKVYPQKTKDEILPALRKNEALNLVRLLPQQHFTQPPARYSEATLIRALEDHGIGRPSTYAPTISVIQDRGYVQKNEDRRFQPEEIGFLVNDLLVKHFPQIVDIDFTAKMEKQLDDIAEGTTRWTPVVKEFYGPFNTNLKLKDKEIQKMQKPTGQKCPDCGADIVEKFGRFGKFHACSNYPDCRYTEKTDEEKAVAAKFAGEKCERCGADMVMKNGRFGPFLGCANYPNCKNIKNIEAKTGVACPQCQQGEIVAKRTKRGRTFYACNRYPECKFALWDKPTGEHCPRCQSLLVQKNGQPACSNKECA